MVIGKGDKARKVVVSLEAVDALKNYLAARRDNNPALFVTFGDEPKRLQRYDLSKSFRYYANLAGIQKEVHAHIMRHTYATTLKDKGCNIMDIKDLLGHSDIKTTAKYYFGTDINTLKDSVDRYLRYD